MSSAASISLLRGAAHTVGAATDLVRLLDDLVRHLHTNQGFALAAIYLDDPGDQSLTLCGLAGVRDCPASAYRVPRTGNFLSVAAYQGRLSRPAPGEPLPIPHPAPLHMAVPLMNGVETSGVLWLAAADAAAMPADENLLALGDLVALGIRNVKLYARERARAEREAVVNRLSRAIGGSLELDDVLRLAVELVGDHLNADRCGVAEIDLAERVARIRHQYLNPLLADQAAALAAPLALGPAADWLARLNAGAEARAFYEGDVPRPLRRLYAYLATAYGVRSLAVALVPPAGGSRRYVLAAAQTTHPRLWQDDELAFLQGLAAQLAVAICNARLYAQVQATAEQLRQTNAELEAFVYTASHDLQAPIVSLQGFATLLADRYGERLDERGRAYLQRLAANAAVLGELLQDLLELSRIGRLEEPDEIVDVGEVVSLALAENARALEARNVRLTLPEAWPTARYSRRRLLQVLGNLISNAAKFMGQQPAPAIELGWQAENGAQRFWVRDNGIGIDPADQARIFEPFQRLDHVTVDGAGIGLHIVKRIVEGRGGQVEVKSALGQGATFAFTIPRTAGE